MKGNAELAREVIEKALTPEMMALQFLDAGMIASQLAVADEIAKLRQTIADKFPDAS